MRNKHEYPSTWYDTIRPEILIRDKYKCTQCGIKHRSIVAKSVDKKVIVIDKDEMDDYSTSGYKVYRIFLHVCHLDNNKQNCTPENLRSLCVTCHAKQDASFKAVLRKGNKRFKQMDIYDIINQASPSLPANA